MKRWAVRNKYLELNKEFKKYCDSKDNMNFANVWDPMLGKDGTPMKDIFIEDGLHMNSKGYDIWAEVLREYVE
ncbi:MAG: hypothetical protein JXQ96_16185 [Cyclobacteriaceae bacterium]